MADINNIEDVLAEYADQSRTGTVMVVFSDNTLGRFYVVNGALATARYHNRQGREALALAQQGAVKSAKFHANSDLVRSKEFVTGAPVDTPAGNAPAPAATPSEDIPQGQLLTGVMRSALEEILADFIGPVAPIMVSDLPQNIAIETAIAQLSSEIPDASQASRFVRAARLATSG